MSEIVCYLCQEPKRIVGHDTNSCPFIRCKKCGKQGHSRRYCPISSLKKENEQKNIYSKKEIFDSTEHFKTPVIQSSQSKNDGENEIEENESLVLRPLSELPHSLKLTGELTASIEFLTGSERFEYSNEEGIVEICLTDVKTNDYVIVEKTTKMKGNIVTLKFMVRSGLTMVDPNL